MNSQNMSGVFDFIFPSFSDFNGNYVKNAFAKNIKMIYQQVKTLNVSFP